MPSPPWAGRAGSAGHHHPARTGHPGVTADPTPAKLHPAHVGARRRGRDLGRVRRCGDSLAARPGGRGRGRRGRQLHLRRGLRRSLPRALLRDVHRRAAARGRRRRASGMCAAMCLRRHLRGVLPRLRLHPHGRHLRGQHPACRLARRSRDRRRRSVADGPGRHRRAASRTALSCVSIPPTRPPPPSWSPPWPTRKASSTCAPPAAPIRSSTRPRRHFRSAGPKFTGPVRMTRWR